MICSTHTICNECPNDLLCGDQGECLAAQRQRSRQVLDRPSVGERFMLMFGRGVVKRDPLRVEWKDESNDSSSGTGGAAMRSTEAREQPNEDHP